MLRFEKPPDIIFTAILDRAFKLMISELQGDTSVYAKEELEGGILRYYMAHAKRNFTIETIIPVIKELAKYNREAGLWELNDYHYLVIYDVLRYFCNVKNDEAKEIGEPILVFKEYRIDELDFDAIVDFYFFDEDFLWPAEVMLDSTAEQKRRLAVSKELFGILNGMQPHSEELKIKLLQKGNFYPQDPDSLYFSKQTRCYLGFDVKKYEEENLDK